MAKYSLDYLDKKILRMISEDARVHSLKLQEHVMSAARQYISVYRNLRPLES